MRSRPLDGASSSGPPLPRAVPPVPGTDPGSPPHADLDDEQIVVLDRAQSSVTPIDLGDGSLGAALRVGNGATNVTVDHYGRVLVANTRDNEIIGLFGSSLVMRFRHPVPEGPFAVDYDDARNGHGGNG